MPGALVNLNSRHFQEVASQRQEAAVRTFNREVRLRTNDTIQVTDAAGRILTMDERQMWRRIMQLNAEHEARYQYVDAQRKQIETDSNWSTNAMISEVGAPPSRNWAYQNWAHVFNAPTETWDEARERDRWSGLDYKAQHFTWTHKCFGRKNCNWSTVSQNEISYCGRCCSEWIRKYPTFNSTWRTISNWYFTSPCDRWYFFCTRRK